MKTSTWVLVGAAVLFGAAGVAKADDFTFVSDPNSSGTYFDASGSISGNFTYASDPSIQNVYMVDGGVVTVVSNVPPTPWPTTLPPPYVPYLNGTSEANLSDGGFILSKSSAGVTIQMESAGASCPVCFEMPGNLADGGGFYLGLIVDGVNGAQDNGTLYASDGNTVGYFYSVEGTFTFEGEIADYPNVTPEPSSWLLLGSGIAMLGFLLYQRSRPVSNAVVPQLD